MQRRQFALVLIGICLLAIPAFGQKAEKNVACVGDSITFGAGIKDREKNSYPVQLGALLGAGYKVSNFGVSGATLLKNGDRPYWRTGRYKAALESKPDIVVIKLGTNDTKPQNWKHKDDVSGDLEAMLSAFRELPSKPKVYLCLPVPAFPERWGIRDSVIRTELIPIIKEVANDNSCPVIDLYKALDGKKEFFPDKIHPNKDGAAVIAKSVHAELTKSKKSEEKPKPAAASK